MSYAHSHRHKSLIEWHTHKHHCHIYPSIHSLLTSKQTTHNDKKGRHHERTRKRIKQIEIIIKPMATTFRRPVKICCNSSRWKWDTNYRTRSAAEWAAMYSVNCVVSIGTNSKTLTLFTIIQRLMSVCMNIMHTFQNQYISSTDCWHIATQIHCCCRMFFCILWRMHFMNYWYFVWSKWQEKNITTMP